MTHEALPTNDLSQELPLRRQYARNIWRVSPRSHVASSERVSNGRRLVMPGAAGAHESEHDEKMTGAWESDGPASVGLTQKVQMFSGSPMHVTKIITDVS